MTQATARKRPVAVAPIAPAPAPAPAAAAPLPPTRRLQVRSSTVHGRGVFTTVPIAKGERLIEYKGELITWAEAIRRHPHDPSDPNHTFYFEIDDGHVIDGKYGGNSSRWINHACEPNCEAQQEGQRVFLHALRKLKAGEELFFDYGLVIDERHTAKLKKQYECRCGKASCRHTMLAPKARATKAAP